MEAVLFIAVMTAVHLAAVALLDVLTGTSRWQRKLGWALVVVLVPWVGPAIYYRRAPGGVRRSKLKRAPAHRGTAPRAKPPY